jgi:hypothetical protein
VPPARDRRCSLASAFQAEAGEAALLLADISGYTSFLQAGQTAHRDDAFTRAYGLDLKFVLHAGRYVAHQIAGSRELRGPAVVVAHRLLKNRASEAVGQGGYALLTDAAVTQFDLPVGDAVKMTETYEGLPPIAVSVVRLAAVAA